AVENAARLAELRQAVAAGDREKLRRLMEQLDQRHRDLDFNAWVVADNKGNLLAYSKGGRGSIPEEEKNFAWRDWFHGQGDRHDDHNPDLLPIQKTHVSNPYYGRVVQNRVIAVSTPIRQNQGGPILGLVQASISLEELHDWLTAVEIRDGY